MNPPLRSNLRLDFGALNGRAALHVALLALVLCSLSCRKSMESIDSEMRTAAATEQHKTERPARQSRRVTNQNFLANLPPAFTLPEDTDELGIRILEDYGAMFVSSPKVTPPPRCIFSDEDEVRKFQEDAKFVAAVFGKVRVELQPAAMAALLEAREEARQKGLNITPRGGPEAARRSYQDTLRLWDTRFRPALAYWSRRGRLSREEVESLRRLPLNAQVERVLELEKSGIFFSKDLSKSILYSVAAPGASQHISMLALDVSQFSDERVRRILARHGWFQTVYSDLTHFTYLGVEEKDLPSRGLRPVKSGSQLFWVPALND